MAKKSIYKSHYKDILRLGIPIIIGQIGIVLVGIADNIMLGRFSTEDLASASFVNSVFNIPIFVALGFSYGLTPLVGQEFGRNGFGIITRYLKNSLLVNFLVSVLLAIAMGIIYLNLDKMGQPTELIPLIKPYLLLQLASLPFIMIFNSFKQFSEGITNTKRPMQIMLIANILNIIGNYILIYGMGTIPPMGVVGAGISTLISRIFMATAFAFIFFSNRQYTLYSSLFRSEKINRRDILSLNKMGWFIGLQLGMETSLFSMTGVMVGWLGKFPLAAHQVMVSISTLGFMIYYGVGSSVSVLVSNYYGKGNLSITKRVSTAGLHIVMILVISFVLLLLFGGGTLASFYTTDSEILTIISIILPLLIIYQFGDGLQIIYANSCRGIGDVSMMALLSFIGYFVIALPVSYLCGFTFDGGLFGIWVGYPVGLTITGILLRLRFYRTIRREIQKR